VLKVGAATETELKEKKARIEDAVSATRAAVEEGILPGGGVTYLGVVKALDAITPKGDSTSEMDVRTGISIVQRALEEPIRTIAENAGAEGSVVVENVRSGKPGWGYNAATGEYVNMVEAGIVDPAKVTRSALENAASIAAMLLTTECLIADIPEKEKMPAMPGGGGMPGMY